MDNAIILKAFGIAAAFMLVVAVPTVAMGIMVAAIKTGKWR